MPTDHPRLTFAGHCIVAMLCVALFVVFLLAACSKAPVSEAKTDNPEIPVELLFEHEGIKVYRFYDRGRPVYFTDLRGRVEWTTKHNTGKSAHTRTQSMEMVE